MKVKAVVRFTDNSASKIREVGEEFDVGQERYNKLRSLGLAEASGTKEDQKPKDAKQHGEAVPKEAK